MTSKYKGIDAHKLLFKEDIEKREVVEIMGIGNSYFRLTKKTIRQRIANGFMLDKIPSLFTAESIEAAMPQRGSAKRKDEKGKAVELAPKEQESESKK